MICHICGGRIKPLRVGYCVHCKARVQMNHKHRAATWTLAVVAFAIVAAAIAAHILTRGTT